VRRTDLRESDPPSAGSLELAALHVKCDRLPPSNAVTATDVGNVLAAADADTIARYGLDLVVALPRLSEVLAKEAREMLEGGLKDINFALDLSSALGLTALVSGVAPYPRWLVVPIPIVFLSFLAYKNAVTAAVKYAEAQRVAFDLNRMDLYVALGFPKPQDLADDRMTGTDVTHTFGLVSTHMRDVYAAEHGAQSDERSCIGRRRVNHGSRAAACCLVNVGRRLRRPSTTSSRQQNRVVEATSQV
jgi:hypothetical protein